MNNLNNTEVYKKEINDWFASGKDFDEGFVLFVRFSHNRALAMQLSRKRIQSKLEYELQKILERTLIIERPVMPISVIKKAVAPVIEMKAAIATENSKAERIINTHDKVLVYLEGKVDYESLTDEQKALYDANRDMYKEMRTYHEKMKLSTTDEDRKAARERVVELDGLIRENWKQFDASFLPAGEKTEGDEPEAKEADPIKEIGNARSYISKTLKAISEGKIPEKKLDGVKKKALERYQTLIAANQVVDEDTVTKLKACGIIVE